MTATEIVRPLGRPTAPGHRARTRAALPLAVRDKLEALEQDERAAHSLVLIAGDRVREADEERGRVAAHLVELTALHPSQLPGHWVADPRSGPRARTFVPAIGDDPAELERDLARMTDDLERLVAARAAAETRWRALAQIVERARLFLGL